MNQERKDLEGILMMGREFPGGLLCEDTDTCMSRLTIPQYLSIVYNYIIAIILEQRLFGEEGADAKRSEANYQRASDDST